MSPTARLGRLLAIFIAVTAVDAAAEPVTIIRNNGPSARRVDLVVLGDGFTAGEVASGVYSAAVESFVASMFAQQPYLEYQKYFNVHRVDVVSNESGSDHPEIGVYKDTALGSSYNCSGIQRLICVNSSAVNTVLGRSGITTNGREMVLILVNDTVYGGSGGAFAVASMHSAAVEIILHEIGHSFGLLADEYGGPAPPSCNLIEPSAVNVTMETRRALIKWTAWIDPSTPLPTTGPADDLPGLYQGGYYCDTGMYRATYNSKMRSIGRPFESVNTEQLVRRIYNYVPPIDTFSPSSSSITAASQLFSVTTPEPWTHTLDVTWQVDGAYAGSGPALFVSGLSSGIHQVTVTVHDPTPMVRTDAAHVLTGTRTWTLTVGTPPTITTHPAGQTISPGQTASLSVLATGAAPLTYQWFTGTSGTTSNPIGGATSAGYTTPALSAPVRYWVRVSNAFGSADSNHAFVSILFTDDPLVAGSTVIRVAHVLELRARIDALRARFSQPLFSWSDPALAVRTSPVRALHFIELRTALAQVYVAAGLAAPVWSEAIGAGVTIKAAHIAELRAAVVAIE